MKIGIVTHISRAPMACNLIREVQADVVNQDKGFLGHRENHRLVWEKLAKITGPNEWALVLEDDAIPCEDFPIQARMALNHCPADVASPYLGRLRPPHWQPRVQMAIARAEVSQAHWIVGDIALHGVAIAMRGNMLINSMLKAAKKYHRPIDEEISMWARQFGHDVAYTWPSLVEHRDGTPLVNHADGMKREQGRVAYKFGTRPIWNNSEVNL